MDVGGFFRGRAGLWRTAAIAWLVIGLFLLARAQVWNGLHDLDTDDAMRLVQVRDWLAGQDWFDVDQHRGWPAPGFSIHWSRIPDLALGGLIALFGLVLPAPAAETAALVLWPLIQLFPALAAVGFVARRLAGAPAMAPAMLLFGLLGPALWQFPPGRIDHHALQLLGALVMLAGVMGLRRGAWMGVLAGLGGALSLAVGLEALVFWLVLCGAAGLILARDGARVRDAVLGLGLTVALATPLMAFAFNPTRYVASAVCDQVAWPVLALAVVGGLGLALAAGVGGRLASPLARLALSAAAGVAGVAAFAWAGPACLQGPFAAVDPRLGPIWLDHVQEARTLPGLLGRFDPFGMASAVLLLIGLCAMTWVAWRRPARRWPLAILGLLWLASIAMLFVQMRGIVYSVAFASPLIAAAMVGAARDAGVSRRDWGAVMLVGLILAVGLPLGGRALGKALAPKAQGAALTSSKSCFDPGAYAGLGDLPPGLVAAPIDSGPFILMASPHQVMSAPYHRNPEGIVAVHEMLKAPPAEARVLARNLGVDYVVVCRSGEVLRLMRLAPAGLAARLEAGEVPDWLAPAAGEGEVRAWRVR
ncbi:MAG: hypothetical protein ACK4YQ_05175 [Phenylobacterium sp.]|uniref:hypothetical protein n=1 Tax=Phenylobacterium sp. TaxID=1871053 RepID=UPI00391B768D